jgi:cobalamin biosynthesis Mg chelatase CobN
MYCAGNEGTAGAGGTAAAGAGGPGPRGGVAQPVTISRTAAAAAARTASERRGADKMVWFFLEALVALLIAVGIVAWTMGPKRRKRPRVTAGDADAGKKDR